MKRALKCSAGVVAVALTSVVVYAAASYPTSVKSFTTKLAGQTVASAHINDIQDEIVAIEGALINGFAHAVKPSTLGGQDLGTTTLPWGNGYFTGLPMDIGLAEGRLTLTSGTPVTTADVTGATTVYWTPFKGNRIALYDGTNWALYAFTEVSLALGTLTNDLPYDVYIHNNAGTLTLESLAWTNKTTRATALTTQNGVLVKTGATTRRYLGTFHTTATTTTEDSFAKRLLWNYYNRVERPVRVTEATDSWAYTSTTVRQTNGSTANQVAVVVGVAEVALHVEARSLVSNASAVNWQIGIGEGSTTTIHAQCIGGVAGNGAGSANAYTPITSSLKVYPAVGYQFYASLESSTATGTSTWQGDGTFLQAGKFHTGIQGFIEG